MEFRIFFIQNNIFLTGSGTIGGARYKPKLTIKVSTAQKKKLWQLMREGSQYLWAKVSDNKVQIFDIKEKSKISVNAKEVQSE